MISATSDFALETAACLWEAVLAMRDYRGVDADCIARGAAIQNAFGTLGTAAVRLLVIGWTPVVDAAWARIGSDYQFCFDWDFVPAWIIDNVDWSDPSAPRLAQNSASRQSFLIQIPMQLSAIVRTGDGLTSAQHLAGLLLQSIECVDQPAPDEAVAAAIPSFSLVRASAAITLNPIFEED
ncbi:hypothetical protein [Rhizorhabdus histidinilytica]|uniref:hypothetical protein n=1 Tax=Rhizorhabdus histidinilytica TaxID=439228 RepID=UPI001ADB5D8A|nr:hypothetical protein [Rhizorhabdus histidinilytica]